MDQVIFTIKMWLGRRSVFPLKRVRMQKEELYSSTKDLGTASEPRAANDLVKGMRNGKGWAELTSGSFKSHVLAWGHFYFMEGGNESSLTNLILNALRLHYTSSPWLNCVLILDLAGFDQTDKAEYNEQNTGQYFRYLVEEVLKNVSSEILETHQTMSLQWSGQLNWDASRRT